MFLNTIVADPLEHVATAIEKPGSKGDRREAIEGLVREFLVRLERSFRDTPAALAALMKPENVELFERFGILTPRESAARASVRALRCVHTVDIEALAARSRAAATILPAAIAHQERPARSIRAVVEVSPRGDARAQAKPSRAIDALQPSVDHLNEMHHATETEGDSPEAECLAVRERDVPAMSEVRPQADRLETPADDES